MHAFGVHLSLEKCKKPRTGRGFLRIHEGKGNQPTCTIEHDQHFLKLQSPKGSAFGGFFHSLLHFLIGFSEKTEKRGTKNGSVLAAI